LIGGSIVERWQEAYPIQADAPLGLAGWQAAFILVGLPGLLLACLVFTLKEPLRGESDGIVSPPPKDPFRGFFRELIAVIPPFTLFGAAQAGARGLAINLIGAAVIGAVVYSLAIATGNFQQWIAVGIGYYAIFSWASTLQRRDAPTYKLIWGTPAFLTTILGYGMVAFMSYAASFWAAPYAIRILEEAPSTAGWWIGGPGALGGFLGVILGGRAADWLRERNPAGRLIVVAFGLAAASPFLYLMFTTQDPTVFYIAAFLQSIFGSSALGGAAATTQDLVLPRMRGTATATFFLATTLVGLALGPYMAGQVSAMTGSLSTGGLSLLIAVPIGLILLLIAYKTVPEAERSVIDRARAAGEDLDK